MKKSNNLNQEVLPMGWQALDDWPKNYHKYLDQIVLDTFFYHIDGMDIETEGLNPYDSTRRILSIAISPGSNIAYTQYTILPNEWKADEIIKLGESLAVFKELLTNPKFILVGHNIKFDVNWIRVKFGIDVSAQLFDTMYAQYLLDENRESNKLEDIVNELIPELAGYKQGVNRNDLKRMSKDDLLLYNGRDSESSRRLFDIYIPKLEKEGMLPLMTTSMEVLPVLSRMETYGVWLDKEYADKNRVKLFENAIRRREVMNKIVGEGVDPDSTKSLQWLLYTKMKLPVEVYTKTGEPSTDKEAMHRGLDRYAKGTNGERLIRELLDYKKEVKLLSTYYSPIQRWTTYDGRVHTNYRLGKQQNDEGFGGTVTGRLSSDNPNLQNIPIGSSTRGMFAATPGTIFFDGDYSQLELRVTAYLSQDRLLLDAFEQGLDIHTKVMSDITGIAYDEIQERKEYDEDIKVNRVAIKRINFGILYGVQAARLQKLLWLELGITWPLEKCQELINMWLAKFTKVSSWLDYTKNQAVTRGFVTMPFGQKRRLPDASFYTTEGRRALRQAINFPVQSTASWICLVGMTLLDKWIASNNLNAHLLMQVHDSVCMEVKNNSEDQATFCRDIASKISNVMEGDVIEYIKDIFNVRWNIPLQFKVSYGERWK